MYFLLMNTENRGLLYQAALYIADRLTSAGYEALFAGGFVRDMVMELNDGGDIDIATSAHPDAVRALFPHTIPVGAQFGVIIVVHNGFPFEVATFRSDTGISDGRHPADIEYTDAQNDALRRDYTINGLFFDPRTEKILDHVGGMNDIASGTIRAIGDPELRFREDYLRMLRAVRFAARFDFSIEAQTWSEICRQAPSIKRISVERIFAELDKMLCSHNQQHALDLLDQSGLLPLVLPEVAALKGVEQPPQYHPEGDVFEHTKKALSLLGPHPSSMLAWSVLLHDIGKPSTMVRADRVRFNNHDQAGMEMAREVLRRFHTSNAFIDGVAACVGNHMNFMQVKNMRLGTLKKFLSRPTIDTEMELHRIDCLASHGNCDNLVFLAQELERLKSERLKPSPFLRGRDLVDLGFKPGPRIGEILASLYEMQLEEEISTKEEALDRVRKGYSPDA